MRGESEKVGGRGGKLEFGWAAKVGVAFVGWGKPAASTPLFIPLGGWENNAIREIQSGIFRKHTHRQHHVTRLQSLSSIHHHGTHKDHSKVDCV